jgi:hypothetical protein
MLLHGGKADLFGSGNFPVFQSFDAMHEKYPLRSLGEPIDSLLDPDEPLSRRQYLILQRAAFIQFKQ